MKPDDRAKLIAEVADMVRQARGAGPWSTANLPGADVATAHRILDAIDRRTPAAPPERIACVKCHAVVPFDSNAETWCMKCGAQLSRSVGPKCPAGPDGCVNFQRCFFSGTCALLAERAATPGTAPAPPSEPKP